MPESNWNDSMTRFLLSLPGGYSAIRFSFQAGDTFYVKLAPCWHGWLSLQSNQSMEAVDFRDGICNNWSMVPLPSLHMSHMPAVEFERSVWSGGRLQDCQGLPATSEANAHLGETAAAGTSKDRKASLLQQVPRENVQISPNYSEFWMIQLTLSKYTVQDWLKIWKWTCRYRECHFKIQEQPFHSSQQLHRKSGGRYWMSPSCLLHFCRPTMLAFDSPLVPSIWWFTDPSQSKESKSLIPAMRLW